MAGPETKFSVTPPGGEGRRADYFFATGAAHGFGNERLHFLQCSIGVVSVVRHLSPQCGQVKTWSLP
jgi:hypothetical protein